eukprot:4680171-Pyramimonas_sp.AAC.1
MEVAKHRAIAGVVDLPDGTQILCVSLYLRGCEDLSDENLDLLPRTGSMIGPMGYPVIIGGDFNMIPSVAVQSHLGDSLGQWMIPGDTTCNSVAGPKVHDYFFVSPGLSKGVARVSVRQD